MGGAPLPRGLRLGMTVAVAAVTAIGWRTSDASPKSEPMPPRASNAAKPAQQAKATKAPADGLTVLDTPGLRQVMRKAQGGDLFIHLWASWCGPCMEELPDIDRLARQTRARGAAFLSVSLDDPRRAAHVLEVLHRQAPSLTHYLAKFDDPDKFADLFSGEWDGSIPALFVYDRTGHLRASFVGQLENADIRRMLADISAAPSGPPGLLGNNPKK